MRSTNLMRPVAPMLFRQPSIVGGGYGVLPRLVGEAHGEVVIAGAGAAVLPIIGAATGEVGGDWPDDIELALLLAMAA
jgi:hypothetical protein